MQFEEGYEFAKKLDDKDALAVFREQFLIPKREGREQIYFLGNSLGLQPSTTSHELNNVLGEWADYGVEGFFHGKNPWLEYHEKLTKPLAHVVGAKPEELVVMNQLTVNLHLMMISFYRPLGIRNKILCEAKAFPSDQYMLETHLRYLGLDPSEIIIEVSPRKGQYNIDHADIVAAITHHREELALVFWGGINYYTGQVFDISGITRAAHEAGAIAGFDLAHAAGNITLALHDWDVDFACWCSYKYLNSGPGAIGGVYIHERFHKDPELHRFAGWWGYHKPTRFKMDKGFVPVPTAEGWQLSTPSILLYASHFASLEIFEQAGMKSLLGKAALMSDYLYYLLNQVISEAPGSFEIITPQQPGEHGCQVSMFFPTYGRLVFDRLSEKGIFSDWREPGVIRIAPVPLYNKFTEIFDFAQTLRLAIISLGEADLFVSSPAS